MEPIYERQFTVTEGETDPRGLLTLGSLLHYVQEVAGDHSTMLGCGRQPLWEQGLFWAVLRHRAEISRLPHAGEAVTVTTWPMPTTRSAYPRAAEARDKDGNLLFRTVSAWVLMDVESRKMVLPGRSGILVDGIPRGTEPDFPTGLAALEGTAHRSRQVLAEDLDENGHMNNCRYLDWAVQLLPAGFSPREFTACYLSEARLGEDLALSWVWGQEGGFRLDALREEPKNSTGHSRVFAVEIR